MASDDHYTFTANDPQMHELYERAQRGQLTFEQLAGLSDDALVYLAGHEPAEYFELDATTEAGRLEQRSRRSKLIHNMKRADLVLAHRWTDRNDEANRALLDKSVRLTRWLVVATIVLALATVALTIATFRLATDNDGDNIGARPALEPVTTSPVR